MPESTWFTDAHVGWASVVTRETAILATQLMPNRTGWGWRVCSDEEKNDRRGCEEEDPRGRLTGHPE